jgi:hypothetical protein
LSANPNSGAATIYSGETILSGIPNAFQEAIRTIEQRYAAGGFWSLTLRERTTAIYAEMRLIDARASNSDTLRFRPADARAIKRIVGRSSRKQLLRV